MLVPDMDFTDAERSYLSGQRLGRIATASAAGQADVAPVTFTLSGNDLLVGGLDITKTRKYRNVLATGNAAFVVDDLVTVDPWQPRGVKVHGEAVIETAGNGKPRIRITPTTVWSWGINDNAEKVFASIEKRTASTD
jgi:pyridoxamine 5'-phosphate oxidase family protein